MAPLDREGLAALAAPLVRLTRSGSLLIATDFDGTLAPVVRDPARAHPLAAAVRALEVLASRTPVAVISGRDLANLLVQCPVKGAYLLGSYGLEPWLQLGPDSRPPEAEPSARLQELAGQLWPLEREIPGVQIELKTLGIAVHYRNAGNPRAAAQRLRRPLLELAQREHLSVLRGRRVMELRPGRGGDKGTALAQLLDRIRPRGCVYAGDDLGDVPAMRVLHQRAADLELALAMGVVSSEAPDEMTSQVDRWLHGPRQWAELLVEVAAQLTRDG